MQNIKNYANEPGIKYQYMVKHLHMRDAQVLASDPDDPFTDDEEKEWRDYFDEPIIDIVWAENEDEAVERVSKDTGYHPGNLVAEQVICDASGLVRIGDRKRQERIEAVSFCGDYTMGIKITRPDGRIQTIVVDLEDGSIEEN